MTKIKDSLQIGDTGYSLEGLVPHVLYHGSTEYPNDITLNDRWGNYKYIVVYFGLKGWGTPTASAILEDDSGTLFLNLCYTWMNSCIIQSISAISFNNRTVSWMQNRTAQFKYSTNGIENVLNSYNLGINMIVGYK